MFSDSGAFLREEVLVDNVGQFTLGANVPDIAALRDTNTLITWVDLGNGDVIPQNYNPLNDSQIGTQNIVFNGATGTDQSIRGHAVTALNNDDDYVIVFGNENPGDDTIKFQFVFEIGLNQGSRVTVDTFADAYDPSIADLV